MFLDTPQYELKPWGELLIELVMQALGDMHMAYRREVDLDGGMRDVSRGKVCYE